MPIAEVIPPRSDSYQGVKSLRFGFAYNSLNAANGRQIGTLPLKAMITGVHVSVEEAFNAGTTNVLTVGTTLANANELVASGDVTPGALGYTNVTRGRGTGLTQTPSPAQVVNGTSVDTTQGGVGIYAKFAQTGSAATTGRAVVVVEYVTFDNL